MQWPTWFSVALFTFFALTFTALPPLFLPVDVAQYIWVSLSVVIMGILSTLLHYFIVTVPLQDLTESVEKCVHQQGVTLHHFEQFREFELGQSQSTGGGFSSPAASLRASRRFQIQLLEEVVVGSGHKDIFRLQGLVKDLTENYFVECEKLQALTREKYLKELEASTSAKGTPTQAAKGITPVAAAAAHPNSATKAGKRSDQKNAKKQIVRKSRRDKDYAVAVQVDEQPAAAAAFPKEEDEELVSCQSDTDMAATTAVPRVLQLDETEVDPRTPEPYPRLSMESRASSAVLPGLSSSPPDTLRYLPCLRRGGRFPDDNLNICLFIENSKNSNIVVYEGKVEYPMDDRHAPALSLMDSTLDAYWLDLDPDRIVQNRAKGKLHNKEPLAYGEKKAIYGFDASPMEPPSEEPNAQTSFRVNLVCLPSRSLSLTMEFIPFETSDTVQRGWLPVLLCGIQNELCIAERFFIETRPGKLPWSFPRIVHIDLYGFSLNTGEMIHERISV